ncbi:MAG: hypothetical protein Q9220_005205 [cf. Caloplaca sp. 1 TL-2023]
MTLAGLNSVNLSEINTFQQFILFLLMILGSAILVSIAVLFVRLKAFERRFKTVVDEEKRKQKERGSLRRRMTFRSTSSSKRPTESDANGDLRERHNAAPTASQNGVDKKDMELGGSVSPIVEEKVNDFPPQRRPLTINTNTETQPTPNGQKEDHHDLPSGIRRKRGPTITFASSPVTAGPQRIAPLARILSMQGVGARHDLPNHPTRIARAENLLSPVEERHEPMKMSDLVHRFNIPGITGRNSQFSSLSLDDRERIGGVEYRALEILAIVIGNGSINTGLSHGTRALDGFFQALAVRSGGFYVVTVANLRIGLLILYVLMMYISVYPVVITMRNSNVYEERSLGIYSDETPASSSESSSDTNNNDLHPIQTPTSRKGAIISGLKRAMTVSTASPNSKPAASPETRGYFVRQQLRGQLAHDLWWVVLAVLFITITETSSFEHDPKTYSVFNIMFEVVSAYGCVGLSVGLPTQAYSFAGGWHVLSKLILCAVMIRGRHRGLPVAIDRAVLLPGDHLALAEEEDALIRMERSATRGSGGLV